MANMLLLLPLLTSVTARDLFELNPPFPRIGTLYGTGLAWRSWEQGADWWSKLDLIVGGCYDLHYDWENPRWSKVLERVGSNLTKLREVNPECLVLPYVDVVEGPDNPNLPASWWDLRNGERWSGWPGMYRIKTTLPEVLQFNLDKVRDEILARDMFDGVFYDCWGPDDWLVPRTAQLRGGRAVVMVNDWNFPAKGFEHLNGALAEDEVVRVMEGLVEFEDFLARYLRWCREARKPRLPMIVGHPRSAGRDPWVVPKMSREQRQALIEQARNADPQSLRFGLCTTLLGDGYFAYDGGNGLARGCWWWYPEYDAPLGYPKGEAVRGADGLWRRDYDGGAVFVNGTGYDAAIELPRRYRDVSSGRVASRFTLPGMDGRILLPTDEPASGEADQPPRLTAAPPEKLTVLALDGQTVIRTPRGLDLRFQASGALLDIRLDTRPVMTGGWPIVATPPFRLFTARADGEPELRPAPDEVTATWRGSFEFEGQRAGYLETVAVLADNRFRLHFEFTALTALNVRMWRHCFNFPCWRYAGGTATAGGRTVTLPAELGGETLLAAAKAVTIAKDGLSISIDSSLPLGLVDHRRWGSPEYLLAGYPINGQVEAGRKWTVDMTVTLSRQEP